MPLEPQLGESQDAPPTLPAGLPPTASSSHHISFSCLYFWEPVPSCLLRHWWRND